MYSGDLHRVQIRREAESFGQINTELQYCVSRDTLEDIVEIFGDDWFIRDFQSGDDVDFCAWYGTRIVTASNPENMHLLCKGKYEWGLFIYIDYNSAFLRSLVINMINLKTGESKSIFTRIPIEDDCIGVYNLTANTKGFSTLTSMYFVITIMREMYTNEEKLVCFNTQNYYDLLYSFFASFDGAWAFDFRGAKVKHFNASTNNLKYILINAMINLPNHLFESIGDIKIPLLHPSTIERPRIVNIQDTDYLIAQGNLAYDSIFYNVALYRIEDNE